MADADQGPLRPKELALLLLASGEALPRQRARDQQADVAGLELKRRLLTELVTLDPEPDQLNAALAQIVELIGPPTGPTRGVAASLQQDWEAARSSPEFVEWLLRQAISENERPSDASRRKRRYS